MDKSKLLEKRKKIKSKKPDFIRQDSHKKKRLNNSWRSPKGWQSKVGSHKRGHTKVVLKGYGSPVEVKGLHPTGLKIVMVCSAKDLETMNSKEDGALISGTVGLKKKLEIVKKAKEKGITILNIKNVDEFVKTKEDLMKKRKEEKTKKVAERENKKKEAEKKAEKKKEDKLGEKVTEEEKKEQEKKEKDKALIQRE